MDFQIRITKAALADFEEILAYSWAHFPESAESFGNALASECAATRPHANSDLLAGA